MSSIKNRWSTDQLITGIETGEWLKLLKGVGYDVAPEYLHRLAWVSAWSLPATVVGRMEDARFGRKIASMNMPAPIFLLGHWRSGTTHLHNLLGRVPEHTYPTVFQVVFPTAFLSMDPAIPNLTARLMTPTRAYDNVAHGWHEAAEDEIALAKLTGMSPYLSFMFPERSAKYERYIDFMEASPDEREQWLDTLKWFLRKVSLASGGHRVVCKSCGHTARVRMLVEAFPDARFVYIHRNPFEVYASTIHMRSHTDWENFFQVPAGDWEARQSTETLDLGERIFDRWAADRRLIPPERLFEVGYEELAGNEVATMERLWAHLELPRWGQAEAAISEYVDGLQNYKRNELTLTERDRHRVRQHWQSAFETYHYDLEDGSRSVQ